MRTNGAWRPSASRTSRTSAAYALSDAGVAASSSKASPALVHPPRAVAPACSVRGSGSPVSAESSTMASVLRTIPSVGITSPARTSRRSPMRTRSTSIRSTDSPVIRFAAFGARSTSSVSSRRARLCATSSSAFPPASIIAITAPARYSPSANAPAIARRAIASTPTSPRISERPTETVSGTSRASVVAAQIALAGAGAPTSSSTPPAIRPVAAAAGSRKSFDAATRRHDLTIAVRGASTMGLCQASATAESAVTSPSPM